MAEEILKWSGEDSLMLLEYEMSPVETFRLHWSTSLDIFHFNCRIDLLNYASLTKWNLVSNSLNYWYVW